MINKWIVFIFLLGFTLNLAFAKEKKNVDSFASLKFNEVNVRAGPNIDFPLVITYKAQFLPIKIVGEYDNWLKIIDKDGDGGWVKSYLVSRTAKSVVVLEDQLLYSNYNIEAYPTYRVEKDVVLMLKKCKQSRCKVKYGKKISGWIDKDTIWGIE